MSDLFEKNDKQTGSGRTKKNASKKKPSPKNNNKRDGTKAITFNPSDTKNKGKVTKNKDAKSRTAKSRTTKSRTTKSVDKGKSSNKFGIKEKKRQLPDDIYPF